MPSRSTRAGRAQLLLRAPFLPRRHAVGSGRDRQRRVADRLDEAGSEGPRRRPRPRLQLAAQDPLRCRRRRSRPSACTPRASRPSPPRPAPRRPRRAPRGATARARAPRPSAPRPLSSPRPRGGPGAARTRPAGGTGQPSGARRRAPAPSPCTSRCSGSRWSDTPSTGLPTESSRRDGSRSGNGIVLVFHATGTGTSLPSTRAAPPLGSPSSIVRAVPAEIPKPRNASRSRTAPGSASANDAARQSEGTTSKPTPGRRATPAFTASACRCEDGLEDADLAGDVEVRHPRLQAGVHGGGARPREGTRGQEERPEPRDPLREPPRRLRPGRRPRTALPARGPAARPLRAAGRRSSPGGPARSRPRGSSRPV